VPPECKVGIDSVLECRQPQLLQPRHLRLRERLGANILVRMAAPKPERVSQARRRRFGLRPFQLGPAALDQMMESLEVQLSRQEAQSVSEPVPLDPLGPQPAAQPVHVHLQGVHRRRGGC
jgi:hypothetical protein